MPSVVQTIATDSGNLSPKMSGLEGVGRKPLGIGNPHDFNPPESLPFLNKIATDAKSI